MLLEVVVNIIHVGVFLSQSRKHKDVHNNSINIVIFGDSIPKGLDIRNLNSRPNNVKQCNNNKNNIM